MNSPEAEPIVDRRHRPRSAPSPYDTRYRDFVASVAGNDVVKVLEKDKQYGASWKRRGGSGAFFQGLARKWDRIDNQLEKYGYNIFAAIIAEQEARERGEDVGEGILDTLQDLRRYGLLVEAEMIVCGYAPDVTRQTEPIPQLIGDDPFDVVLVPLGTVGNPGPIGDSGPAGAPVKESIDLTSNQRHALTLRVRCIDAAEGERYSLYHEYAKTLGYGGLGGSDILHELQFVNGERQKRGARPLPDAEIHQIINHLHK